MSKKKDEATVVVNFSTHYTNPNRLLASHVMGCEEEINRRRKEIVSHEGAIKALAAQIEEYERSKQDTLDVLGKLGIKRPTDA
jgi:hypothetical protein